MACSLCPHWVWPVLRHQLETTALTGGGARAHEEHSDRWWKVWSLHWPTPSLHRAERGRQRDEPHCSFILFWWTFPSLPTGQNIDLYNSSHKLSPHIQRVVLHHVKGHCAHDQHMLLVMQVHTTVRGEKNKKKSVFVQMPVPFLFCFLISRQPFVS